jgi:CheY-like chemotaxis protein
MPWSPPLRQIRSREAGSSKHLPMVAVTANAAADDERNYRDSDGLQVAHVLRSAPATSDIPIIFVTAVDSILGERRGLEAGAVDYGALALLT